jgi:hypothetical protein
LLHLVMCNCHLFSFPRLNLVLWVYWIFS